MRLPSDENRWSAQFKYVEVARYIASNSMVARHQVDGHTVLLEWPKEVEQYKHKYNNTGIYTSIFRSNKRSLENTNKLANLYFDLDDKEHPEKAQYDAIKLVQYLRERGIPKDAILVYFSGMKGFHVELEALALGIGPSADLPEIYRYISEKLTEELALSTIDTAVYEKRRMWRLPYSKHQATGLYKCLINHDFLYADIKDISNYAKDPEFWIPPFPEFSAKANAWYRHWIYDKETKKLSVEESIERFTKFGTQYVKKVDNSHENMEFDPKTLMDKCHAVKDIWDKAEKERYLTHEERLFLCSLLTYTDDAIEYMHHIISNVEDYNYEKTQSHIDDWIKRRQLGIGGRPFTCNKANALGVGCGDCELERKPKWETYGDKMVETGNYADPSPIRFAYRRKE